ncbi:MAG TPA: CBS domain-containing protein [Candidatus Binatia bacterium]|nr:CBS domain-containing protein [Candidatus Binatia bacterium]
MRARKDKTRRIRVADWMTENVLAVETFDSIGVARRLMAKHRVNQLPVLDHDVLVGIVTDRDLRDAYPTSMMINRGKAIDRFADSVTVEEVMSHDVFTVGPDTPLKQAVGLLRRHRIGSLPVVKNKNLVGIITRSDILDFVLSGLSIAAPVNRNKRTKKATLVKRRTRQKPKE